MTYNANGATGGSVPVDATNYAAGQTMTIRGNTGVLVKSGSAFTGWNTKTYGNGRFVAVSYDGTNRVMFADW